ncbi:reverse transcriptase domain-containing protein [Tanacetum coccineum]|uniref:Reverse transcriptase domain-containing protein n=1 Tax=Tanacetum coccineum TaxID=301880 RepID=A0ABQ5GV10_9ASTR
MIGSTLTEEGRNKLCNLLQQNLDVFAWKPADMTSVLRHIAEHRLNVCKGCSPVRQKKRGQAADRNQAIQEEVGKLVEAGIMREVHYHDWLSNPVMAITKYKWQKGDEEKTTFITSQGIFCYTKMPFGLRNAGATYQRLVDKAFQKQIGRNLEVYVDDLVIKSRTKDEIVRDMEETFRTLREINMKLNPKKCTFGIEEGMFLGYKVSTRGLKVCPDKVDDVLSLPSPKYLKDVQKLNGKLAKAKEAFKQMNQLIAKLSMLVAPMEKEELVVYLAATKETVSAVLMTERETKQMPIYFVSRALRGPKVNYTSMEKLVLALVHASKRLKRYFQAHPIIVIAYQPIQQVLSRLKVAGRLQKWSIELGEYAIHYRPRVSVKGQILADFIVERPEEESLDTLMGEEEELPEPWILFMDESTCTDGSGAGLILTNPEGMEFTYALRFRFDATNNEAEYEALIAELKIAEQMGVKNLQANVDSRLVANQVNGTYVPRNENKKADALSKIASTSFAHLSKQVMVEELKEKSISAVEHARSVVAKALRIGYYWPTMHEDVRKLIRACQDYQVHKPIPRSPQKNLSPITSPWPFYKCGIDIAGPFLEGHGRVKFLIVAIDYFTKWIEAKPHLQTNGLVERANRSLREGIKARLDERSKNWMEELPHVLWAHRTMIKSSNGDTPFSLTYGTEAVIPAEIGMPTLRTAKVDLVQNDEALEINLDLLEERREQAAIREAKSKAKMERYYNSKVRSTSFKPGDLVYRNNDASRAEDTGKLGPRWEGPYEVTEAL